MRSGVLLILVLAIAAVAAGLFRGAWLIPPCVVVEWLLLLAWARWITPVNAAWTARWAWCMAIVVVLVVATSTITEGEPGTMLLPIAAALGADAAALCVGLGWFDARGLMARAALEADPELAATLRRRVRALGQDVATSERPEPPLPIEEPALLKRLEVLSAWSEAAATVRARRTRLQVARQLLLHGLGPTLFLVPLLTFLVGVTFGARAAYLAAHAGAAVLWATGLVAVGLEHGLHRLSAPLRAVVGVVLPCAGAALLALAFFHARSQLLSGLELDPGVTTHNAWTQLERLFGSTSARITLLLWVCGLLVPAALWGSLARDEPVPDAPRPGIDGVVPARRLSSTLGGTPWFLAVVLVFVIDTLAVLPLAPGLGLVTPWFGLGHMVLVALGYAGLGLLERRHRRGVRRTIEDERRRVVTALVRLRQARDAAGS